MLGKRRDTGPGHNMVLTFIGAGLLWVGWFGFNAGSAVTAGLQAGMAMTVTQLATAVAALTWMFVEWAHRGKPTVIGICSGAVAGLVAITPASGYVGPIGSIVIGVACGVGCYWGATGLKHMFGYDDALDCFGVHGVGGIIGAILTGVFAINEYSGHSGLIEGNPGQVVNQLIGIGTVIVYDAIVTAIILKVVDIAIGLRVSDEIEREGLDYRPAWRSGSVSVLSPAASGPPVPCVLLPNLDAFGRPFFWGERCAWLRVRLALRLGRACPGHPLCRAMRGSNALHGRSYSHFKGIGRTAAWMPGTSPGMTQKARR